MSNRLTFSLASLVFLIVLGLVLVPTAVMAHNYPAGVAGDTAYPASSHPLTTEIADDPSTAASGDTIAVHHSHPTVESIMLKAGDKVRKKEAKIAAADETFTLVIKFSEAVGVAADVSISAFDTTNTAEDGDFPTNGVTITLVDAKGNIITNGFDTLDAANIERSGDNNDTFEVTVTVDTPALPTAKKDDALEMVEVRVSVPEDTVYSLAMLPSDGHALRDGAGNLESMIEKFMLVKDFTSASAPDDPDPVMFAVSGTPSLTDPFTVTFTSTSMDADGDPMGAEITDDDIMVTGGYHVMQSLNSNSSPADAPMTVWTVIVQPYPGATSISVTIKDDMKTAAAADAKMGTLMHSAVEATLSTIKAAEGADDTAAFVVTLTFAKALPEGVSVDAADLMVTPTTAKVGRPGVNPAKDTEWLVLITPTADKDTVIGLSKAGMVKFAYSGTALTVMKETTVTAGAITVKYDAATMTTTLSGVVPANGFASISRLNDDGTVNYPDLQKFFDIGGTIDLHDADTADADDKNSREVVMSEILWGLDRGAAGIDRETQYQFIEFYNTTGASLDITGWTLVFSEGRPTDAKIDVDQVSNRPPFGLGFAFDVGKSGRVTGTEAVDPESAILPENIVSMYRDIAYATVKKTHDANNDTENRKKQLAGVPSGSDKAKWLPSKRRDPNTPTVGTADEQIVGTRAARWIYASRNAEHHTVTNPLTATPVPSKPFRINEIGNDVGSDNDWVELYNDSDGPVSLENYALSAVKANGTDDKLFDFAGNKWSVPAKGFIVIATRHPQYTDLATGKDVSLADDLQDPKGLKHLYVKKTVNLPDNGKFTLILRNAHDKQKSANNVIDVAASPEGGFADVAIASKLWPLVGSGAPGNIKGDIKNFASGKVYQRDKGDGRGGDNFSVAGYTGIGYDVNAEVTSTNNGTPGYANGALKPNMAGLTDGVIKISEIMVDVGDSPRRKLPQWIELHNSSKTLGINLDGWKINIENAAEADVDPETNTFYATITLGAKTILPNQTVLVVSRTGDVRNPDHFPRTRVVNLWTTKAHREALEMTASTDQVLSSRGFSIQLVDKDGNPVDRVGNLDGIRHTRDKPVWTIPMSDDPESRSSMLRVHEQKVALDGTMADSWRLASDTILAFEVSHAYYGNADDVGTPGFRDGGPLPVRLSKFRPERLDDGTIAIRWITESELNNAGFNILRSETRNGEFKQINTKLIAGKGTTSERSTYTHVDSSAKPNVVYYYQIQDVSLDGKVTTLRETRLKGHISAAGKLTTTWGELKALQ